MGVQIQGKEILYDKPHRPRNRVKSSQGLYWRVAGKTRIVNCTNPNMKGKESRNE
jgi:hypothetical protein